MYNLSSEAVRGGTLCLSKAGVAEGGTAQKIKTAAPNGAGTDFAINGILYHLVDVDDFWTMSGDAMAIASECLWLLCINAAGTMSVVQGDTVTTANIDSGYTPLRWPGVGPTVCPLGGVKVVTVASIFTPGTTALTGTATYYDFLAIPEQDIGT